MDLTQLLTNAQAAEPTVRKAAEDQLSALETQNYATFLGLLVAELANEAKPKETRTLAGLMLKNALSAKEEPRLLEKQNRWRALDANAKAQIRAMLLQTLTSQARPRVQPLPCRLLACSLGQLKKVCFPFCRSTLPGIRRLRSSAKSRASTSSRSSGMSSSQRCRRTWRSRLRG